MNSYSAGVELESGATIRVSISPRWEQQKEHSSPQHSMDKVIEYRFVNYGIPSALFRACAHSQPLVVPGTRRAALEMYTHFHRYWIRLSAVFHSFGLNGECAKQQKPKPFADENVNRVQFFLSSGSAAFFFFFALVLFHSFLFVAVAAIINTFPFNFTYALADDWVMY